jgi:cytidylate kinase
MLDFLGNDDPARAELWAEVPIPAQEWAQQRVAELPRQLEPTLMEAARLTLALAARGDAVLVGRGAGFLLPAETTVHVHVVAPREQRLLYLAERLRLTPDEAEKELVRRDARRAELRAALGGPTEIGDFSGFDLVLNTHRLGVDACAELILQAVRWKQLPPSRSVAAPESA